MEQTPVARPARGKKRIYERVYEEVQEKQKQLAEGNKVPENGLPLKEWKKVIDYFDNECAYCGERDTELEQDHIIPVSKGGKYEMGNIIPACRSCNSSKQNKNIYEWYEQQEFYNGLKLNKIVNFCKLYNVNLRKVNVNTLEEDIKEEIDIDIEEDKNNIEDKSSMSVKTDSAVIKAPIINFEKIKNYWNEKSKLKEITMITEKRKGHLNARIKEHGIDAIYKVIDNVANSSFLRGENKRGWIANFDWVFRPNNFVKVLEGNYLDETPNDFENDIARRAEKIKTFWRIE